MGNKGPLKVLNGTKLILDDHGNNLDSFTLSLESFRFFRGPLLHKSVTGTIFWGFLQQTGSRYLSHGDSFTCMRHIHISGILLKLRTSKNHTSGICRCQGPGVHTLHYAYVLHVCRNETKNSHTYASFFLSLDNHYYSVHTYLFLP